MDMLLELARVCMCVCVCVCVMLALEPKESSLRRNECTRLRLAREPVSPKEQLIEHSHSRAILEIRALLVIHTYVYYNDVRVLRIAAMFTRALAPDQRKETHVREHMKSRAFACSRTKNTHTRNTHSHKGSITL